MTFRKYFTGTVVFALLLWAPINNGWTFSLAIRIGYLILIPLTVWLLLGWIWRHWQFSDKVEILLNRILSGIISITFIALAFLEATSITHVGNTRWTQSIDGMEAIGEDILLTGPNWGSVFVWVLIAGLFLWFGVLNRETKNHHF